jgi:hypothetical protein
MASARFLLSKAGTPVTGDPELIQGKGAFTVEVTGKTTAGAGAANVDILVSNLQNGVYAVAGNFVMVLDTSDAVGVLAVTANWPFVKARVNSISGTGALVDATAGWR